MTRKFAIAAAAIASMTLVGAAALAQGGPQGGQRDAGWRDHAGPKQMQAMRGDRARGGPEMRAERMDGMFGRFDADKDGRITAAEVETSRAAMFAQADENGDGELTAEEAAEHRAAQAAERVRAEARNSFAWRDRNGDGTLSPEEFAGDAPRFFSRFDADGDGAVTREEVAQAQEAMRR